MQDDLAAAYPPGAPMTYWRLNAERQALRFRLKYLEAIRAGCKTCEHFGHARGFNRCAVFDETPPAEFIDSDGKCESWLHDGVPY
jgi:hypothetical protein